MTRSEDARRLLRLASREAGRRGRPEAYRVLLQLGKVGRVAFCDDAGTARLRLKGGEFRLEFSAEFVEKQVRTPADLLHLVLHELLHRINGDLRKPVPEGVPPELANLAADLLVNAEIDRTVLGGTPGYFRRLYRRDRFPENLLLPPALLTGLPRDAERRALEAACRARFRGARDPAQAARVYLAAWLDRPSFEALLAALAQLLLSKEALASIRWLGDHDRSEEPLGEEERERLRARLRELGRPGAGYREDLDDDATDAPPERRESALFREAVRRALVEDPACPRTRIRMAQDRGVLPFVGRRDAFLLAGGAWPGLFACPMPGPEEDERRVHVYVDASGSTRVLWAELYGLILHLRDEIGDPVWAFSNRVAALEGDDLRRGRVPTTGGTDFDCVAEHALDRRHRRILVLTDGEAGLDGALARSLLQARVGVFTVLTQPNDACPLLSLPGGHWVLPREGLPF